MPCHRQHRLFSSTACLPASVLASFSHLAPLWPGCESAQLAVHCPCLSTLPHTNIPLQTLDRFAVRYCCWFCVLRALKETEAASFHLSCFCFCFSFCVFFRSHSLSFTRKGRRARQVKDLRLPQATFFISYVAFFLLFLFYFSSQMWFIKFSKSCKKKNRISHPLKHLEEKKSLFKGLPLKSV